MSKASTRSSSALRREPGAGHATPLPDRSSNRTGARLAALQGEAAVRQHQEQAPREPRPRNACSAARIGLGQRLDVGVRHRRRDAPYSPISGDTSDDSEIADSGSARRSPRRWHARAPGWHRSAGSRWRGSRHLLDQPATSAIAASTSSGFSTDPSAASRSIASRRHGRGTSGFGHLDEQVVQLVLALAAGSPARRGNPPW